MPIYEYKCQNDHEFEKLVPVSATEEEKEILECPECGTEAQRQVSKASFILKGKWFRNSGGY